MTRKDYETIAATLKGALSYDVAHAHQARSLHALLCNDFAARLKAGNELFDRVRFLKACGLDDETIDAL
jgi:hypothetical protein